MTTSVSNEREFGFKHYKLTLRMKSIRIWESRRWLVEGRSAERSEGPKICMGWITVACVWMTIIPGYSMSNRSVESNVFWNMSVKIRHKAINVILRCCQTRLRAMRSSFECCRVERRRTWLWVARVPDRWGNADRRSSVKAELTLKPNWAAGVWVFKVEEEELHRSKSTVTNSLLNFRKLAHFSNLLKEELKE